MSQEINRQFSIRHITDKWITFWYKSAIYSYEDDGSFWLEMGPHWINISSETLPKAIRMHLELQKLKR